VSDDGTGASSGQQNRRTEPDETGGSESNHGDSIGALRVSQAGGRDLVTPVSFRVIALGALNWCIAKHGEGGTWESSS
jgi:hypothetical protein